MWRKLFHSDVARFLRNLMVMGIGFLIFSWLVVGISAQEINILNWSTTQITVFYLVFLLFPTIYTLLFIASVLSWVVSIIALHRHLIAEFIRRLEFYCFAAISLSSDISISLPFRYRNYNNSYTFLVGIVIDLDYDVNYSSIDVFFFRIRFDLYAPVKYVRKLFKGKKQIDDSLLY